ncbi:hypothetical protein [Streptomyces sp. NPDC058701]
MTDRHHFDFLTSVWLLDPVRVQEQVAVLMSQARRKVTPTHL